MAPFDGPALATAKTRVAQMNMTLLGRTIDVPSGSRIVVVSAVMALVLIVRPGGLTGGRGFSLPTLGRLRPAEAK